MMTTQPLFINTRPHHRADGLRTLSVADVVDLPLLAIHDLPIGPSDQAHMAAWARGHYDLVVVTSVESAKRAIAYLQATHPKLPKPTTPMVAVGDATAAILAKHGYDVALPDVANNEGMLRLAVVQDLTQGAQVLIWRGVGGRRLLHDRLIERGVHIDAIEWYERTAPTDLLTNFTAIAPQLTTAHRPICVLISSQMAFENWCALPHRHTQYHYLALGDRLHGIIHDRYPTTPIHTLTSLAADEIGAALQSLGSPAATIHHY